MATLTAPTMMQTERPQALEAQAAASDSELIETHMRRVFRLIYRVVGNVPDAQDLTQDAFVKALKRREQLKDPEKAALGRIAVNALDHAPQQARPLEGRRGANACRSPEQTVLRDEERYRGRTAAALRARRAALILRASRVCRPGGGRAAPRPARCARTSPTHAWLRSTCKGGSAFYRKHPGRPTWRCSPAASRPVQSLAHRAPPEPAPCAAGR